jgi:hypothetical protein
MMCAQVISETSSQDAGPGDRHIKTRRNSAASTTCQAAMYLRDNMQRAIARHRARSILFC